MNDNNEKTIVVAQFREYENDSNSPVQWFSDQPEIVYPFGKPFDCEFVTRDDQTDSVSLNFERAGYLSMPTPKIPYIIIKSKEFYV